MSVEVAGLPEFEGQVPIGVNTKITGAGQRIARALHLDDRVYLLVEATVANVGHKTNDAGLVREHKLKVEDLFELDDDGRRILARHRAAAKEAEDRAAGREPLPFTHDDTENIEIRSRFDASGISLGPDQDLPGLLDPEALLTVRFAGGVSGLWPDDWEGSGQSLVRTAGGSMRLPGGGPGDTGVVVSVSDVDSGAVVSEWTDVHDEVLSAVEAAEEAAGNRAAVEALEAARTPLVAGERIEACTEAEVRAWVVAEDLDGSTLGRLWAAERGGKGRKGVLGLLVEELTSVRGEDDVAVVEAGLVERFGGEG